MSPGMFVAILCAAPALLSIDPPRVPTAGGPVNVLGFELSADMTVRAGGRPATEVEAISANQLRVVLPPGDPGPVTVTLESGGRTVATLARAFSYVDAATLDRLARADATRRAQAATRLEAEQASQARTAALAAHLLRGPALGLARELLHAEIERRRSAYRQAAAARERAAAEQEEADRQARADQAAKEAGCLHAGYDDWQATSLSPDGRHFIAWSVEVVNACDRPRTTRVILTLHDRNGKEIQALLAVGAGAGSPTLTVRGTALEGSLVLSAVRRRAAQLVPQD